MKKKSTDICKKQLVNNGMTLPEVMVSALMFAAFTGLFAIVSEFTTKFYEGEEKRAVTYQRGFMLDQSQIRLAFDRWSRILSQPGYSKDEILELTQLNNGCTLFPATEWGIPGIEEASLPTGYLFCIQQASGMDESEENMLYSQDSASKPGVYILYAKPVDNDFKIKVTSEKVPVRRLFCRPKPYCTSN